MERQKDGRQKQSVKVSVDSAGGERSDRTVITALVCLTILAVVVVLAPLLAKLKGEAYGVKGEAEFAKNAQQPPPQAKPQPKPHK